MRFESFVGFRHLFSMRGSFLSTLTILAVVGVALGVAAYTTVVSVATGFVDSFRERVLGVNPHIVVTKFGVYFSEYEQVESAIQDIPGVISTSPFILQEMLVSSGSSRSRPGAIVKGMRVSEIVSDPELQRLVISGSLADLEHGGALVRASEDPAALAGVALGRVLAMRANVEVGDTITLLSPLRGLDAIGVNAGSEAALHGQFRVVAIIDSGFFDYDSRLIVLDYRALQQFFGRGDVVTGVDVRVDDVFDTARIMDEIDARLTTGRYRTLDWPIINRNLFTSLNLQKFALQFVMSALVWVASLVIVCVLVMLVLQKRREIAIMRSMGATPGAIMRIFVIEGMTIGTLGTTLGLVMGYGACLALMRIDFGLEFEVYRIDRLPVSITSAEFMIAGAAALTLCFLATLYPSYKASRVSPLEALRYD